MVSLLDANIQCYGGDMFGQATQATERMLKTLAAPGDKVDTIGAKSKYIPHCLNQVPDELDPSWAGTPLASAISVVRCTILASSLDRSHHT